MNKVRCPICDLEMPGVMADWPDYPFCTARCRKIDLGRWLSDRYRIPGRAPAESEDESSAGETDNQDD